ncbi:MAG: response regulator, partial [Cyanothece sp. SIO1E1]|nr:response regulator [Cyanothece sp. SIO1E1]
MSVIKPVSSPTTIQATGIIQELSKQIQLCKQRQFTGQLNFHIHDSQDPQWSLLFRTGQLVGGTSTIHPIRRWCRQLSQHCSPLAAESVRKEISQAHYWDYSALLELVRHGKIRQKQMVAVVEGNVSELLFDLMQWEQQRRYRLDSRHDVGLKLLYKRVGSQSALDSMPVLIQAEQAWAQAKQAWDEWQQAGLADVSPNLAPVIWDAEELRRQTSLMVYHNLTSLIDGDRTLRDLAVKLKQNIVPLTQSLMPYIQKGLMGFVEVGDLNLTPQTAASTHRHQGASNLGPLNSFRTRPSSPLVAYIEDNRFDSAAMGQVVAQAGYRCVNIKDPVQALPILLEQKPGLIFLDLLMP